LQGRTIFVALTAILISATALLSFQKPFREYPGMEYTNFEVPPDASTPAEFIFARMMYPNAGGRFGGFGRGGDWRQPLRPPPHDGVSKTNPD
jgi:hypothetical protein